MICRTIGEVIAAAEADAAAQQPLTKPKADEAAAILAPWLAAREQQQAA
jgi:hypothetical protein